MAKARTKVSTRTQARTIYKAAAINRCLEIIAPAADHRGACRQQVAMTLDLLATRDFEFYGVAFERKHNRELGKIVHVLGYAAMVMEAYPHLELLEADRDGSPDITEWARLTGRIASIAERAKEQLAAQPRRTKPPDDFKRLCAEYAFDLIKTFGTRRPTLTDGGAFYRLAAVLHAATIGGDPWKEDGLERACRAVSGQRRRE